VNEENPVKGHFPWLALIVSVASSLIVALIIQLGGAIWWGSKVETVQALHTTEINELKVRYAELNESGTKRLPLIDQRLKALEEKDGEHWRRMNAFDERIGAINPLVTQRFEATMSLLNRLDNRQDRFSDALDAMWNTFNDYVRNPGVPLKNTPLPRH
jgi:hypothetical protein